MLYVLGSRAAVSIENARLYESLVDTNKDLSFANVSLEENFRRPSSVSPRPGRV